MLAGALVVGASVKASLRELAVSRLGNTDALVASTGFFRAALGRRARRSSDACRPPGFIALDGLAADGTNTRRAANVAIYGIDDAFFAFHGFRCRPATRAPSAAARRWSARRSRAISAIAAGDGILARLPSPSIVPSATLHGRRDTLGKTMRATVRAVLPESGLGSFSLRPNQGEVRAIYLPLARVQRELERPDRVNADGRRPATPTAGIADVVKAAMTLADAGLSLRSAPGGGAVSLESDSGIIGAERRRRGAADHRAAGAVDAGVRLPRAHDARSARARSRTRSSPASSSTSSIPPAPAPRVRSRTIRSG